MVLYNAKLYKYGVLHTEHISKKEVKKNHERKSKILQQNEELRIHQTRR